MSIDIEKGVDSTIKAGNWLNDPKTSRGLFLLAFLAIGGWFAYTQFKGTGSELAKECERKREIERKEAIVEMGALRNELDSAIAENYKLEVKYLNEQVAELQAASNALDRNIVAQKPLLRKLQ